MVPPSKKNHLLLQLLSATDIFIFIFNYLNIIVKDKKENLDNPIESLENGPKFHILWTP